MTGNNNKHVLDNDAEQLSAISHCPLCLLVPIRLRLKYLIINTLNNIRDQLLIQNRHILNNYDNQVEDKKKREEIKCIFYLMKIDCLKNSMYKKQASTLFLFSND